MIVQPVHFAKPSEAIVNQEQEKYQGEYRDIWCDHNHQQEFEHELINRKTTWSLTAQTILFTAYGLVLGIDSPEVSKKFRYVVAGSGLALAVLMFIWDMVTNSLQM